MDPSVFVFGLLFATAGSACAFGITLALVMAKRNQ